MPARIPLQTIRVTSCAASAVQACPYTHIREEYVTAPSRSVVIIGETNLARQVCASLRRDAHSVTHLVAPDDAELREALASPLDAIAVLQHDDVAALRYALAVAHLDPRIQIIVTIFDRTVAQELLRLLPQCHVTSPADLAAPTLAGPCLASDIAALHDDHSGTRAVQMTDDGLRTLRWTAARRSLRSLLRSLGGQLRPHDEGTRIMLTGLLGMLAALCIDGVWLVYSGFGAFEALFDAARVVATVGPAAPLDNSPAYKIVTSVAMLATVVFTAMFTAGLIDRMLGPKLVGLIGPRALPRIDHVIVIGMGQIGLRLCGELRRVGIPVVGVERDRNAANVRLARSLGIPVVIGHGADRTVLEQLHLPHARALAAVGSDDLDNIATAIAAHAVAPNTRIVLRAGEHEAIAETRSLLPLGVILDVTNLAAAYVVAYLTSRSPTGVLGHGGHIFVETSPDVFDQWPQATRASCRHLNSVP